MKSLPCHCCLELQTHQDTQAAAGWFPAQAAQETLGEGGLRAALGKEPKEKMPECLSTRDGVLAVVPSRQATVLTLPSDLVGQLLSLLPFQIPWQAGKLDPCTRHHVSPALCLFPTAFVPPLLRGNRFFFGNILPDTSWTTAGPSTLGFVLWSQASSFFTELQKEEQGIGWKEQRESHS